MLQSIAPKRLGNGEGPWGYTQISLRSGNRRNFMRGRTEGGSGWEPGQSGWGRGHRQNVRRVPKKTTEEGCCILGSGKILAQGTLQGIYKKV